MRFCYFLFRSVEGKRKVSLKMQFFDYILLETDVDYLITGREHTGDFQDLNILLLAAMCFICFREFETKKGAS